MHPAAAKHRQNKSILSILVSRPPGILNWQRFHLLGTTASTRRQTLFQHRAQRAPRSPNSPEADAHMWLLDWVVSFNRNSDIGICVPLGSDDKRHSF